MSNNVKFMRPPTLAHFYNISTRMEAPGPRRRGSADRTHLIRDILVGAGIQQQPHAVLVTLASGPMQRRAPLLHRSASRQIKSALARIETKARIHPNATCTIHDAQRTTHNAQYTATMAYET